MIKQESLSRGEYFGEIKKNVWHDLLQKQLEWTEDEQNILDYQANTNIRYLSTYLAKNHDPVNALKYLKSTFNFISHKNNDVNLLLIVF